jgi:hypothetical protein
MGTLSKYRVLVSGILSSFLAVFLNVIVNGILMRFSADPEKDWRFRLSMSTVVMAAPMVVTLVLAGKERRRTQLSLSWKIGFAIALHSMMRDVPAPPFDTPDLFGKP